MFVKNINFYSKSMQKNHKILTLNFPQYKKQIKGDESSKNKVFNKYT